MLSFTYSKMFLRPAPFFRSNVLLSSLDRVSEFQKSSDIEKVQLVADFLFHKAVNQGLLVSDDVPSLKEEQRNIEQVIQSMGFDSARGNNIDPIYSRLIDATVTVPCIDTSSQDLMTTPEAISFALDSNYSMVPFTKESEVLQDRACIKDLLETTDLLSEDDLVVIQGATNGQTAIDCYISAKKKGLHSVKIVGLDLNSASLAYGIATVEALGLDKGSIELFQGDALASRDWKTLYPNTKHIKFISLLGPVLSRDANRLAIEKTRTMMQNGDKLVIGIYIADEGSSHFYSSTKQETRLNKEFIECYTATSKARVKLLFQCFAKTPKAFKDLLESEKFRVTKSIHKSNGVQTASVFVAEPKSGISS